MQLEGKNEKALEAIEILWRSLVTGWLVGWLVERSLLAGWLVGWLITPC